jgi:hypothetical protein
MDKYRAIQHHIDQQRVLLLKDYELYFRLGYLSDELDKNLKEREREIDLIQQEIEQIRKEFSV